MPYTHNASAALHRRIGSPLPLSALLPAPPSEFTGAGTTEEASDINTVSTQWEQHWKHWEVYIRLNIDLRWTPWGPPTFFCGPRTTGLVITDVVDTIIPSIGVLTLHDHRGGVSWPQIQHHGAAVVVKVNLTLPSCIGRHGIKSYTSPLLYPIIFHLHDHRFLHLLLPRPGVYLYCGRDDSARLQYSLSFSVGCWNTKHIPLSGTLLPTWCPTACGLNVEGTTNCQKGSNLYSHAQNLLKLGQLKLPTKGAAQVFSEALDQFVRGHWWKCFFLPQRNIPNPLAPLNAEHLSALTRLQIQNLRSALPISSRHGPQRPPILSLSQSASLSHIPTKLVG